MEILRESPKLSDFIPLAEHQSATPASFYSGPLILYYHNDCCKLRISEQDIRSSEALSGLCGPELSLSSSATNVNGDGEGIEAHSERVVDGIQVWVASNKLFLFSAKLSTGLSIPYPSISLHAIQSLPQPTEGEQQGLYMQLINASSEQSPDAEDEEPETISLTLIPSPPTRPPAPESNDEPAPIPQIQALFNALSECSNLHPDPVSDNQEDIADSTLFQRGLIAPGAQGGGLPPPVPGSGGWITADNMNEYFDEDGNWIGGGEGEEGQPGEELGPGAGTIRGRDEIDGDGNEDDEVGGIDGDETKWRRMS